MSQQDKGLEQFLRQQLFRERQTPLEKFVLRHAGQGSRGSEVDEFPISGTVTGEQIPIWRDDIMTRAQSYADGLGSKVQRFILEAIVEGAKSGPRFAFRLRGEGDEDVEEGEEPANEKGMTAQLMRHNEALMRMLVMTTGSSVQHLQRQLEKSSETIQELVASQNEQRKLVEAANQEQHERDMQMLLTSGQEERKAALFKQFESIIPGIVRKITGQPLLNDQEMSVIGPFINSLTEDQFRAMVAAGNLSQAQQIALFEMYKAVKTAASQKQANGAS